MRHWMTRHPASIRAVSYEALVDVPDAEIASLATWLQLPASSVSLAQTSAGAISTAGLWQARQPIYRRSVGRWRAYASFVPELLRFKG
jgi:hypothetical protein